MKPLLALLLPLLVLTSCADSKVPADEIVAMEKAALDRWGKGDPQGYVDIYAPEITYFDPTQPKRADGIDAMKAIYAPIAGKIQVDHYDMSNVRVQGSGDIAVLSYNLVSYVKPKDAPAFEVRWNCSEVYQKVGEAWKIIHNHWSFIQPELKNPVNEAPAN